MLFLAAGLIILFAKITEEMADGDLHDFDRAILLSFRLPDNLAEPLGPLWLQVAARDVTSLGSPAILTLVTAATLGFLALKRRWAAALYVLLAICGGSVISFALKDLIQRPRPEFAAAVAQTQTYSFPSGHAFLSTVTFLTLGALLARVQRQAEIKIYVLAVAIALTMLTGLSRVYLGVHWPSDVLAGWCAGSAWAMLCWLAAEWRQSRSQAQSLEDRSALGS
jgi:undecaprenyl-diphosphatase